MQDQHLTLCRETTSDRRDCVRDRGKDIAKSVLLFNATSFSIGVLSTILSMIVGKKFSQRARDEGQGERENVIVLIQSDLLSFGQYSCI